MRQILKSGRYKFQSECIIADQHSTIQTVFHNGNVVFLLRILSLPHFKLESARFSHLFIKHIFYQSSNDNDRKFYEFQMRANAINVERISIV